jgi:hypothetical protein
MDAAAIGAKMTVPSILLQHKSEWPTPPVSQSASVSPPFASPTFLRLSLNRPSKARRRRQLLRSPRSARKPFLRKGFLHPRRGRHCWQKRVLFSAASSSRRSLREINHSMMLRLRAGKDQQRGYPSRRRARQPRRRARATRWTELVALDSGRADRGSAAFLAARRRYGRSRHDQAARLRRQRLRRRSISASLMICIASIAFASSCRAARAGPMRSPRSGR